MVSATEAYHDFGQSVSVFELLGDLYTLPIAGGKAVPLTRGTGGPHIVLAGHLDTVPIADNVPSRRPGAEGQRFGADFVVIDPAGRPPEFFTSATSDLISSLYSSGSGSCHPGSDAGSKTHNASRLAGARFARRGSLPRPSRDAAGTT